MPRLLACALLVEIGWLVVGAASARLSESGGFTDALLAVLPPIWGWADALRRTSTPEVLSKTLFIAGLVTTCVGYVAAVLVLARERVRGQTWCIAGGMLLFALTLTLTPGLLSNDLVIYAAYGRIAGVYGQNPYLVLPSSLGAEPLLAWATSNAGVGHATPYGPLWTLLSALLAALTASSSLLAQTFVYRVVGLCAHLANGYLVWRLVPYVAPRADRAQAVLLYAWSPLALFELAGSGHNDGLMLSLTLLGLLLAFAGRNRAFGIGTVWLGALVKWMSALPALYLTAGWFRSSPRPLRLVAPLALFAVLTAVFFVPWLSLADLPVFRSSLTAGGQRYVNAFLDLPTPWLAAHVVDRAGVDTAGSQAAVRTWTFGAARFAVALYVLFELRRLTDAPRRIAEASVRTLLVALLVAATQVLAWYLTWPLALAAPLGVRSRVAQLAVAYSVLYLPIFYAIHEDMLSTQLIPFVLAAFVLGPPIVALLLAIRAPRRLVPVRSRQATA